jgi:hypothetical protein
MVTVIPGLPDPQDRSLQDWYQVVNRIYLTRNLTSDPFSVYAHLAEVVGGLSLIGNAPRRRKPSIDPLIFIPKTLAWWMALCGRVGVLDIGDLLWAKYPGVCTYCHSVPHDPAKCARAKETSRVPDWAKLATLGTTNAAERPRGPAEWLEMFGAIYPPADEVSLAAGFSRFAEEMGELAETLRVFHVAPGYFLSEAADVFAWLMNVQIRIFWQENVLDAKEQGDRFAASFASAYPDQCTDCGQLPCGCAAVIAGTVGRLAHEGPPSPETFFGPGIPVPAAEVARLLDIQPRTVTVGDEELVITRELLEQVKETSEVLISSLLVTQLSHQKEAVRLASIVQRLDRLAAGQELTQQAVDDLTEAIASLPEEDRGLVMRFLEGVAAGTWTQALISGVTVLVQHH